MQRRRHQSGADVDNGHRRVGCRQCVDDAHLIRDSGGIDDFAGLAMKAFERSLWRFRIERARRHMMRGEIIEQGPATAVLPTPFLSAPTKINAGLAMVPPSQQNYSRLHPKMIFTQASESCKV